MDPDGEAWLIVTYALSQRPPSGTRQQVVPVLKDELRSRDLKLLALDIFDEYLRLHVPVVSTRSDVEVALDRALALIEPAGDSEPPEEAESALERYLTA